MPYNAAKLPFPPHFINNYMWEKLKEYDDVGLGTNSTFIPFVFATPTNYEEIWNYLGEGPLLVNCERMLRYRTSPFYNIKREQLAWYVRTTTTEEMMNFINLVITALDREDVAAQAVNAWAKDNPIAIPETSPTEYIPHNVFFHRIKVFVIDESRDVSELGTAKTYVSNKIIIEYDYHTILDPDTISTTSLPSNPYDRVTQQAEFLAWEESYKDSPRTVASDNPDTDWQNEFK